MVYFLFEHDLFRKPVPTPDQVRGMLIPDHALLLHQQQRISRQWRTLPSRGIALSKPPRAAAAGQHQLLTVESPCGQPEAGNAGVAARLHQDLEGVLRAGGRVRESEPAERLVELLHDLPFAEQLIGIADLGLERGLGLHEIEALALALGLENTALDLGK